MTDTATLTITDFLLWQIALEEDGRARTLRDLAEVMRDQGHGLTADFLVSESARVLADCGAKRRVIEVASAAVNRTTEGSRDRATAFGRVHDGASVLQALALPYADHPDFRAEWRA